MKICGGRSVAGVSACALLVLGLLWLFVKQAEKEDAREVVSGQEGRRSVAVHSAQGNPVRSGLSSTQRGETTESILEVEKKVLLRGCVIISAVDGTEYAAEDGVFELEICRWQEIRRISVRLNCGNWETEISALDRDWGRLSVSTVTIGRGIAVASCQRVPVPEDGFLLIRARLLSDVQLRVVDEETGVDLEDVLVVDRSGEVGLTWDRLMTDSLSGHKVLVQGGRSPLRLPWPAKAVDEKGDRRTLFLYAPGYAWNAVRIDFRSGGETLVFMCRGATLEIECRNYLPPAEGDRPVNVWILRREVGEEETPRETGDQANAIDNEKAGECERQRLGMMFSCFLFHTSVGLSSPQVVLGEESMVRLEGLMPGPYLVKATVDGSRIQKCVELGRAEVELFVGSVTTVTIELADRPPAQPVPLAGRLILPEEWGEIDLHLEFDAPSEVWWYDEKPKVPIDEMELIAAEPRYYRWSAGLVRPGKIRCWIPELHFVHEFVVGPDGEEDVELKVGEPAEVNLCFIDANTGNDVALESCYWASGQPEEIAGNHMALAEMGDEPGEYVLRAPTGLITVEPIIDGYTGEDLTLNITGGSNMLTVPLQRPCGVSIVVEENGQEVPCGIVADAVWLEGETSSNGIVAMRYNELEASFLVNKGGEYRLCVGRIPGYEPLEPTILEIPDGVVVKHVIKLSREQ